MINKEAWMRVVAAGLLALTVISPALAQDDRGWTFSANLGGSSNSSGLVMKTEPVLGYAFNKRFSTYVGVPLYSVKLSTSTSTGTGEFMSGLGNAFVGFRGAVDGELLNYSSTVEIRVPTGDESRGFSTGRVTADWSNRFSRHLSSFTPFGTVGIANTVSDTAFFVRPFSSVGFVGHFEGGATYDVTPLVKLGASAYAIRGSGQQRIISRVVKRATATSTGSSPSTGSGNGKNRVFETQAETVSQADIVNDGGFASWIGISPRPELNLYGGYSRSVTYEFNTLFFGIGFRVGK
jgi:hypothetical protein